MNIYDIAVMGGGPAGTSAAITAARGGARVLLLERGRLPRHKVCGEFVSAESLAVLASLLAGTPGGTLVAQAPRLRTARIFLQDTMVESCLPEPAASIERYSLDFALWQAAERAGCEVRMQASVEQVERNNEMWRLHTTAGDFDARSVVDATGRWSNLRPASVPVRYWAGVKAHFESSMTEPESVDLYFWRGTYCGVSRVNQNQVNVCAMIGADELRNARGKPLERIFAAHPDLRRRSENWTPCTDVVVTSPLLFQAVAPAAGGVVRAGDAAGFIDPFAGDGISLALRTGVLAAECLRPVWQKGSPVEECARNYAAAYTRQFGKLFRRTALLRRAIATPLLPQLIRCGIVQQQMLRFIIKATRAA